MYHKQLIILLTVILFCGCASWKKVEYVDREVVRVVTKVEKDTFINNVHDSVYVDVEKKGDTVFYTKYKEKTIYKERLKLKTDTCWKDSIVTKYETKEKEIIKIPKIYRISLIFSILVIIFAFIKLFRWLQIH